MTRLRQLALYSCATNDAPVRGAGVLLAARIQPVSHSLRVDRRGGGGRTWEGVIDCIANGRE